MKQDNLRDTVKQLSNSERNLHRAESIINNAMVRIFTKV
jgi:hypothetical protein